MNGDHDDERSWVTIAGIVIGVVAMLATGALLIWPSVSGDGSSSSQGAGAGPLATTALSEVRDSTGRSASSVIDEPRSTDPIPTDPPGPTVARADVGSTSVPSSAPPTSAASPTSQATTSTTEQPAPTTAPPEESATYPTLPDGSPEPIEAVFDVNQITIRGQVPSQAAKDRLEELAIANAKPGQADTIVNELTINPDVPIGIGVRVVELTSARFPEASADVLPPHAAELDRAVAIMNALPNVTTLVIGHADQRGGESANYVISADRAEAVVNYLAAQGIDPSRLSSRAVGESDLLSLDNDDVAFALNRRTEFVFYGLLIAE